MSNSFNFTLSRYLDSYNILYNNGERCGFTSSDRGGLSVAILQVLINYSYSGQARITNKICSQSPRQERISDSDLRKIVEEIRVQTAGTDIGNNIVWL